MTTPASPPEVSVVIPTRNRARFVRQALASALDQEDVDIEVIVVDDASDDGSSEALESLGDARVRIHRRAAVGGPGRTRNDGIALARGRWIAFLDDDDLWAPRRLRVQLETMGAADFGYCAVVLVDAARRALGTFAAPRPDTVADRLRTACLIPGPSAVVVRADTLRDAGGFRDDFRVLEDWEMWIRLAASGRAAATGDLLVAYTLHEQNAHVRDPWAVIHAFDMLKRAHDLDGASRAFFSWLADENRAAGAWRQAAKVSLRSAWRHRDPEELGRALATLVRRPAPSFRPARLGPQWLEPYREQV